MLKVMLTHQRDISQKKRSNSRRASFEAPTALHACEPDLRQGLFSKATSPGIIIVKKRQVRRVLKAKYIGLGRSILLHPAVGIEVIGIDICHDGQRRADSMRSQPFELPTREFQDDQCFWSDLRQQ